MDHALGAVQEAGRTTGKEQRRAERLAAIRLRYCYQHPPRGSGHRHIGGDRRRRWPPAAETMSLLCRQ
jgi:hypothetical protein